jgi:galactokinase
MDQYISCYGSAGKALLLDCRSLTHELLPMAAGYRIVICNSGVKHDHASGEYNRRRADCERAVAYLQQRLPALKALRDFSCSELMQYGQGMDEIAFRRARHVVCENERTLAAAAALRGGEMLRFGQLMVASHRSLRDDFEVSCRELDLLVSLALQLDGVLGARMTGGGFGGCTVNLVRDGAVAEFERRIATEYQSATGIAPQIYVCDAADGACRVTEGK